MLWCKYVQIQGEKQNTSSLGGFHPSNSKSLFTQAKLETRPFNSQKWLIFIISLKYLYIIQQTGDENTHTYQVDLGIYDFHIFLTIQLEFVILI